LGAAGSQVGESLGNFARSVKARSSGLRASASMSFR
jgi:hypothetical protein